MQTEIDDLKLPNIPVKIVRVDEKLKITAGRFKLELNPIPGKSQTYPLLILDKFITEVTTKLLAEDIDRRKMVEEMREAAQIDSVVRKLHEGDFGGL